MRLLPLLLLTILVVAHGYVFKCLDDCLCETDEAIIHCHNGNRTGLFIPPKPLRGFRILGLTYNKIATLPSEEEILAKFPNVVAIDMEANRPFNCSSVKGYKLIQLITDCGKSEEEKKEVPVVVVPNEDSPSEEKGDMSIADYARRVWQFLKRTIEDFSIKSSLENLSDFFKKAISFADNTRSRLREAYEKQRKEGRLN